MVGEIYLANIYFTNAAASKVRPVLLLKSNSFGDVLYLPLTSNTNTKGISINNTHLKDGYLPKVSVIVYEKIGVIAQLLLIRKIATLNQNTYKQIMAELVRFLQH
ncbi:type II toxin-antitoxin system PemK/MazF family toxin [Parafilimonas sp.]|uniref:type II toxin-antitoxin system PemK/MazF family toxin n=1 Tax=Parafilimonas sp. TaxID=1969739 RepID=UPI0039E2CC9B